MGRGCGCEVLGCISFCSGDLFRHWSLSTLAACFFRRSLWFTETLILWAIWSGVFLFVLFRFVFFIPVVLEASSVWHLTNFELVLSIKSTFIRLGPDWFVCCSGRGFAKEGSCAWGDGKAEKRIPGQAP